MKQIGNHRYNNLVVILLFLSGFVNAQNSLGTTKDGPSILPPSPEAQAFARYGNIPVSLYSGKPDIGIDLFKLSSGTITLPVSIKYDPTGIRVTDIAGKQGLGWLLECGGIISRTIVGNPDEHPTAGYNATLGKLPLQTVRNGLPEPFTDSLRNVYLGVWDGEPDIYSYNFLNQGGRFTTNGSNYITQPLSNTKIIAEGSAFKIIDGSGIQYFFQDTEQSIAEIKEDRLPGITAWYLSKILDPVSKDSIIFTYTPSESTFTYTQSERKEVSMSAVSKCMSNFPGETEVNTATYTINGQRLAKIEGSNWRVNFYYSSRTDEFDVKMDSISVFDLKKQKIFKAIAFDYSYYAGSGKLKLDGLRLRNENLDLEKYSLTYVPGSTPVRTSFKQDHWGYYNGANNTTLIPTYYDVYGNPVNGADREPNAAYMTIGILKRITYPTGGYTEFEFEPHEYSRILRGSNTQPKYNLIDKSESIEVLYGSVDNVSKAINIPWSQTCTINFRISNCKNGVNAHPCESFLMSRPSTQLRVKYANGGDLASFISDKISTVDNKGVTKLMNGNYIMEGQALEQHDYGRIILYYKDYDYDNPILKWIGGGIRIKRIVHSDGVNNANDVVRTFNYNRADPRYSNGALLNTPVYSYTIGKFTTASLSPTAPSICDQECSIKVYSSSSQSVLGVSGGSHVVYMYAEEILGTETDNQGRIQYTFSEPDFNMMLAPPFLRTSNPWKEGLQLARLQLNKAGQPVRLERSEYNYDNISEQPAAVALRVFGYSICPVDQIYTDGKYRYSKAYAEKYSQYFHKLKSKVDTVWDYNQQNTAIALRNIYRTVFDDNMNFNPTTQDHWDSRDILKSKTLKYPNSFTGAVYSALTSGNMLDKVIEQHQLMNQNPATELSQQRTNYEFFSGTPLPSEVKSSVMGNSLDTDLQFSQYDHKGRVVQYTARNGVIASYIWDDKLSSPLAEFKGGAIDQVAYTSFESNNYGGWQLGSGATIVSGSANSVSGTQSLNGSVSRTVPAGNYMLSFWCIGSVSVNGSAVTASPLYTIAGNKNYYQLSLNNISSVTVSGSNLDEIRIYPQMAQAVSYTYDPMLGITSQSDPNGRITYYEYDAFGRLKLIKDQDGNILKKICYNYAGQPEDCQ